MRPMRENSYLAMPLRLAIPRLGVDAPIIAVGLTQEGAMDVPQQAHEVGWYEHSQRPGLKGNAVLAGHLDWYGVSGVFRRLAELVAGDTVAIHGADGQERAYTVEWRRSYAASSAIAVVGEVFEPLERAALTLITCGGRWNPATQRYDTRVVVRAGR
jgi:LPXTG-site transpeptidase (sortase) family protein